MELSAGTPTPLGATWDGQGVNFAITSRATRVDLCLFDAANATAETHRLRLPSQTGAIWHGYARGLGPGQLYGFRAHGPWHPADGARFNPHKVLLDPYTRAIGRPLRWHPSLLSGDDDEPTLEDSAAFAPLGAVINPAFDWDGDHAPRTPWTRTVIYEAHVKGFTTLHPDVAPDIRGRYLGLTSPAAIRHLQQLGVTAVELLPVHARADELALHQQGRTNYWGYNTLGFFAPEPRLATSAIPDDTVREFKMMVRALHAAGIEVLLDVVYNHTAEGNRFGPVVSLRGLDNAAYYRLSRQNRARYEDVTGCGNTLDLRSPVARALVLDSLRYWVAEMHVDGFRFDLTSALLRGDHAVDMEAPLLSDIAADPILSRVKLIAEPWDATGDGYRVGAFPLGWSEWNDQYRDTVRRVWRGDSHLRGVLATRLAGSSDLYDARGRRPTASINFITAHDGFTLADLVAYTHKHNEANGEANRDGESRNFSANWGAEGPTDDPAIADIRSRVQRSLLVTLLVSQGVPMISGGDELGRSQIGNNNAYCHDSPLSWTQWPPDADASLLAFTQRLVALRHTHPVLRQDAFLSGPHANEAKVTWLDVCGTPMAVAAWAAQESALGMWLHANAPGDADVLVLCNPGHTAAEFQLPPAPGAGWILEVSSDEPARQTPALAGTTVTLAAHTAAVLTGSSAAGSTRP